MSNYSAEIGYLILVIICLIIVAKHENTRGRIGQCNDLGMKYIKHAGCITNETYKYQYGPYNPIKEQNITIDMDMTTFKKLK